MKVDKAPQPSYFKHGWIEYHKDRQTKDLLYVVVKWKTIDNIPKTPVVDEVGMVKDEHHLKKLQNIKELQSFGNVES